MNVLLKQPFWGQKSLLKGYLPGKNAAKSWFSMVYRGPTPVALCDDGQLTLVICQLGDEANRGRELMERTKSKLGDGKALKFFTTTCGYNMFGSPVEKKLWPWPGRGRKIDE